MPSEYQYSVTSLTDTEMIISVPAYPYPHYSALTFIISSDSFQIDSNEASEKVIIDTCHKITEITFAPLQVSISVN